MVRLPALCCKTSIKSGPSSPHTSAGQFSQGQLRCSLWAWRSKNSHQMKHSSQVLGCGIFFFFSSQPCTSALCWPVLPLACPTVPHRAQFHGRHTQCWMPAQQAESAQVQWLVLIVMWFHADSHGKYCKVRLVGFNHLILFPDNGKWRKNGQPCSLIGGLSSTYH